MKPGFSSSTGFLVDCSKEPVRFSSMLQCRIVPRHFSTEPEPSVGSPPKGALTMKTWPQVVASEIFLVLDDVVWQLAVISEKETRV